MIVQKSACPVFVGRGHELEALFAARRALSGSRGSLVLIGGEAGIGKSRLLAQFLGTVERDSRPRNIASSECREATASPYAPFREVIARLRRAIEPEALSSEAQRVLALFAPLPRPVAHDEGPLETIEIFAGVAAIIAAAAAKRATIVTIEDLHWCDRSSLELLEYLVPRIANLRVLIVATYRSTEVDVRESLMHALAVFAREPNVVRIGVEPLSPEETRELIGYTLDDRGRLSAAVVNDVVARSDGNPFFAEELLGDALDSGARNGGRLPISIRASIVERLALLNDEQRRIISHAAVLGERFEPPLIAATTGLELAAITSALQRARDLNIVVESGETALRFRHALTRQAVYDGMLRFDARRTHEQILRVLEALPDADRYVDALAYHAWEARDDAKTFEYNVRAGDAALGLRALPEARACFERALEVARETGQRADLHRRIGDVAEMQGRIRDAIEHYTNALTAYQTLGDYDGAADMVRAIATNRNNLADPGAVAFSRAFLAEYGDRVNVAARDRLLALMARLSMVIHDTEGAEELLGRIVALDDIPPSGRQNAQITRAEICFAVGDLDGWRAAVAELRGTLERCPPFNALIGAYTVLQMANWVGDEAICRQSIADADAIETRWEFSSVRTHGAGIRAEREYLLGNVESARARILSIRGSEAKVADQVLALIAPLVAAALDDASLVSALDRAVFDEALAAGTADDGSQIVAAGAAWLVSLGRLRDARHAIARAIEMLARPLSTSGSALVLAARHLDEPELERLRALLAIPIHPSDRGARAHVELASAILARRSGAPDEARARGLAAAQAYRGLRWPLFEADALEAAGDSDAAAALFERCGARAFARRVKPAGDDALNELAAQLSPREFSIAHAIADGATNAEIGDRLGISSKTVEKHVSSLLRKLGVTNRVFVAALFTKAGEKRTSGRAGAPRPDDLSTAG